MKLLRNCADAAQTKRKGIAQMGTMLRSSIRRAGSPKGVVTELVDDDSGDDDKLMVDASHSDVDSDIYASDIDSTGASGSGLDHHYPVREEPVIARAETRVVRKLKLLVYLVLVVSALAVALGTSKRGYEMREACGTRRLLTNLSPLRLQQFTLSLLAAKRRNSKPLFKNLASRLWTASERLSFGRAVHWTLSRPIWCPTLEIPIKHGPSSSTLTLPFGRTH